MDFFERKTTERLEVFDGIDFKLCNFTTLPLIKNEIPSRIRL